MADRAVSYDPSKPVGERLPAAFNAELDAIYAPTDAATWTGLPGKPSVIAAGSTSALARQQISAVGRGDLMINPYDEGAVGGGSTDDTAAVQAAYNRAADAGGGTVILPRGRFYIPGGLTMDSPNVSLIGRGGVLGAGVIAVGAATSPTTGTGWAGACIEGLIYDGDDPYGATSKGITLKNARGFRIGRSRISDVGKAISVNTADGASGFHSLGMIGLQNITSDGVRYFVHADTTGATVGPGNASWQVCSDWDINGCVSNYASIANFWFSGIDGIKFADNVCFMRNYGSSSTSDGKANNVFVGEGDQLSFSNSNLFEAGLSGISLGSLGVLRNFVINGLNIVWPGQYQQRDGIELYSSTAMNGKIDNCVFTNWTRAAIGLYSGDVRRVEIGQNAYSYSSTPPSWLGGGALTSYRIFSDAAATGFPIRRDFTPQLTVTDSIRGNTYGTAADVKGTFTGVASARRSTSITGVTTLFNFADFAGLATGGGLVVIQARGGSTDAIRTSATAKIATYVLLVSQAGVTVVASSGYTSGAAADEPSFTWSVSGSALRATPVGSTSGTFWVEANSLGALMLP